MPNVLNQRMIQELRDLFEESPDCVVVEYTGLDVAEATRLRTELRKQSLQLQIVKTTLARIAARELGYEGADALLTGQAAVIYGGESVVDAARALRDATKGKKSPVVKGGFLGKKPLDAAQVGVLANLPSRHELLGQVLATVIAPLSGVAGLVNELMAATPRLVDALEKKGGAAEAAAS